MRDFLRGTDDTLSNFTVNMNYYTDSMSLQKQLEQSIEKRSGRIYGPPGGRKLLYFIDDLNMPAKETYGTQTPIALLRQQIDHGSWFDRNDLSLRKEVHDVQFAAAMNPTAGSFTIASRLQRHFFIFGTTIPSEGDLFRIYTSILGAHLERFEPRVAQLASTTVAAVLDIFAAASKKFLPSASSFHYNFNMRDISAVIEGITQCKQEFYSKPLTFIRLVLHEISRVFADRLMLPKDLKTFQEILVTVSKKHFNEDAEAMHATPNIFTCFATTTISGDPAYLPIKSSADLKKTLDARLTEYNMANPTMNLELFDAAAQHVTRIARVLSSSKGNALLVGVGGSGKQSLARLAAFICNYQLVRLSMHSNYCIADLREDLKDLYTKTGVKPAVPLAFLFTDNQILDERFLMYINDLLSSGYIPGLFSKDEYEAIFSQLRAEAKRAGVPDSPEYMMEFFIERVRRNFRVILCMSPVGEQFRKRARRFPGIINCTSMDWFHPWSRDALVSVAGKFLEDVELSSQELKENVAHHMAEVHLSAEVMSEKVPICIQS